jgi:hypothetical protein
VVVAVGVLSLLGLLPVEFACLLACLLLLLMDKLEIQNQKFIQMSCQCCTDQNCQPKLMHTDVISSNPAP